jgi:hypothetical protein
MPAPVRGLSSQCIFISPKCPLIHHRVRLPVVPRLGYNNGNGDPLMAKRTNRVAWGLVVVLGVMRGFLEIVMKALGVIALYCAVWLLLFGCAFAWALRDGLSVGMKVTTGDEAWRRWWEGMVTLLPPVGALAALGVLLLWLALKCKSKSPPLCEP